ncbi:hypothetical protein EDB86DRAFT_2831605 [Lactarius hatsudake]|nr:hypothetical protein EDB86DRAFT_2831605 [Lactarius hatsudake]
MAIWRSSKNGDVSRQPAKTVDASFYPHAKPTTTRAAWDILDNVIKPLTTLKEMKDKTLRKTSGMGTAAKYANYAENMISKLQRAHLKKYYPQQCVQLGAIQHFAMFGGKAGKVLALFCDQQEDLQVPGPTMSESEEGLDLPHLGLGSLNCVLQGDNPKIDNSHGPHPTPILKEIETNMWNKFVASGFQPNEEQISRVDNLKVEAAAYFLLASLIEG